MMTRKIFCAAGICGILLISGFLAGCRSAPRAEEATDVWALLARGERERAMPYFLGEVDVNDRDELGRTPLHLAAELRDPFLASFFISLGANPNALDGNGITPLGISAEMLDAPTARVIAAAGSDIHRPIWDEYTTPASIAVEPGHGAFLAALLTDESMASVDASGRTILHLASEAGNARAADAILNAGGAPAATDRQGRNALDITLARHDSRNHAEFAERLILAGAVSDNPLHAHFAPAARTSNYNIRSSDGMVPLHYIARRGYVGYLAFVLERNANVNIQNASGSTPLHEAARSGNLRVMETLLNHGAEVNAQDASGNSALHIAFPPETHLAALNFLLSRGANPNLRDDHGASPLHVAVTLGRPRAVVAALLAAGADVSIRDVEGKSALYLAVENHRLDLIPMLLAHGSDIFAADNNGITPFQRALQENNSLVFAMINRETVLQRDSAGNSMLHITVWAGGNTEVLIAVLDYSSSVLVNARNYAGDTSLTIAARKNRQEAGELLLNRGGDIFAVNAEGESPLSLAFPPPGRNPAELRRWMLTPQTLASRDGLGNTPLHYAAAWRLDPWIALLVEMGANTEAANATGETPLFTAVRHDSPSTIRVLVHNGASLPARDSLGNSALHAAVRWHALGGAETLINLGLNIDSHALNGKTPLHDSIRLGMPDAQMLLLRRGADIEVRDADGNTPFMEAAFAGNAEIMQRLLERGANPNTRNFRGDTPLHIAVAMERSDMISMLLGRGVSIHARNSLVRTPFQNALAISPALARTLLTRDRLHSTDDDGSSPLHVAIHERVPADAVRSIMEMGVSLSLVDAEGRTPIRLAIDMNQLETARLLADSGADVFAAARDGRNAAEVALAHGEHAVRALFSGRAINSRDISGNTILHFAAQRGDAAIISQLLALGAFAQSRNIAAESPADIARRWNHHAAAALLIN
ncbi:MAG: ankyrin repeat domain-containing protein [Treponema sp.]|nr:ankyrin repeat domain-containing protein [Treponema sp.]